LMVGRCWSTAGVSARFAQSLVPFTSGGTVPDQVTVTVWPMLEGTVTLLVGGVDAKLNMANNPPTEHKLKARKTRGFKNPDWGV
jgi:hypothetical protein